MRAAVMFLFGLALATTGAAYWHPAAAGLTAVVGTIAAIWATSRGAEIEAAEKQADKCLNCPERGP